MSDVVRARSLTGKSSMTLMRRLFMIMTIAFVGLVMSGLIAYRTINQIKVNGPVYRDIILGKDLIADVLPPPEYIIESYLTTYEMLGETNPMGLQSLKDRMTRLQAEYAQRHEYWKNELTDEAARKALLQDSFEPAQAFFNAYNARFLPAIDAKDKATARSVLESELSTTYGAHRMAIDKTVRLAAAIASDNETRAAKIERTSFYVLISGTAIITAAVAAVSWIIGLGIKRSLAKLASNLDANARTVALAASQVASAGEALASGASEQAASLEESASAMEEMSSMTRRNAETADLASSLATESTRASEAGNEAMKQMETAIAEIEAGANDTAKIIKSIDEIAFQTNLLALNAAVEAARAGEAGKGFSVVAEEVRSLAQRSADAARHTAELIRASVDRAHNGVEIAKSVGTYLSQIGSVSGKVQAHVAEIASASKEQAQGIDSLNRSVAQMDQVTQQNAAGAEESSAASKQLAEQAASLQELVASLHQLLGSTNNAPELQSA